MSHNLVFCHCKILPSNAGSFRLVHHKYGIHHLFFQTAILVTCLAFPILPMYCTGYVDIFFLFFFNQYLFFSNPPGVTGARRGFPAPCSPSTSRRSDTTRLRRRSQDRSVRTLFFHSINKKKKLKKNIFLGHWKTFPGP